MELLDGFAFECGANTMIIDMERSKRYTKNLFLATYRKAGRYDEGVKLWKTKYQYEFEHGIHVGVDIRGPEFDIYTCEHTRKFYNQMRKDLYKNIKKSLTKQLEFDREQFWSGDDLIEQNTVKQATDNSNIKGG